MFKHPQLLLRTTTMTSKNLKKNLTSSAIKQANLYKFQSQLPKLPVPALQDTASKYLRSVEPFLSKSQLSETTQKVQNFLKSGEGEKLQDRLVKFAEGKDNWLAEYWDCLLYTSRCV